VSKTSAEKAWVAAITTARKLISGNDDTDSIIAGLKEILIATPSISDNLPDGRPLIQHLFNSSLAPKAFCPQIKSLELLRFINSKLKESGEVEGASDAASEGSAAAAKSVENNDRASILEALLKTSQILSLALKAGNMKMAQEFCDFARSECSKFTLEPFLAKRLKKSTILSEALNKSDVTQAQEFYDFARKECPGELAEILLGEHPRNMESFNFLLEHGAPARNLVEASSELLGQALAKNDRGTMLAILKCDEHSCRDILTSKLQSDASLEKLESLIGSQLINPQQALKSSLLLSQALGCNSLKTAKGIILLAKEHGVDINQMRHDYKVNSGDMFRLLADQGCDPQMLLQKNTHVLASHDVKLAQEIILLAKERGVDINQISHDYKVNSGDMFRLLVEQGCNPKMLKVSNIHLKSADMFRFLAEHGCDLGILKVSNIHLLTQAIERGDIQTLETLNVKEKIIYEWYMHIKIKAHGPHDRTVIPMPKDLKTLAYLLKNGLNAELASTRVFADLLKTGDMSRINEFFTDEEYLGGSEILMDLDFMRGGYDRESNVITIEVLDYLIKKGYDRSKLFEYNSHHLIQEATKEAASFEKLEQLIELISIQELGKRLSCWEIKSIDSLKYLIGKGLAPDITIDIAKYLLNSALSKSNHAAYVEQLLDILSNASHSPTPLKGSEHEILGNDIQVHSRSMECVVGSIECVEVMNKLLSAGFDPNARWWTGSTRDVTCNPLREDALLYHSSLDVMKLLVTHGAKIRSADIAHTLRYPSDFLKFLLENLSDPLDCSTFQCLIEAASKSPGICSVASSSNAVIASRVKNISISLPIPRSLEGVFEEFQGFLLDFVRSALSTHLYKDLAGIVMIYLPKDECGEGTDYKILDSLAGSFLEHKTAPAPKDKWGLLTKLVEVLSTKTTHDALSMKSEEPDGTAAFACLGGVTHDDPNS
jgi:hypothetical protein